MEARYGLFKGEQSDRNYALAYLKAHETMFASQHHPAFKFLSGYRACTAARAADKQGDRGARMHATLLSVQDLVRDTNAPVAEVFDPVFDWTAYTPNKKWAETVLTNLMPYIERNWNGYEQYHRWRGMVETDIAWAERGGGYVDTVTPDGWQGFAEHLRLAEGFIRQAWRLNSNVAHTPYLMMRVELGQGQGLAKMRTWFDRAMALNTNYFAAASLMSYYLEPRWHGSEEAALTFARACVASKTYGGEVPLVLATTHRSLARYYKLEDDPEYWQRPGVWKDIQASYEKFFELNPKELGWRHDYARDAYLCGQYDVFLAQAKLFPWTNYPWWGGQQKFVDMVAKAGTLTPRKPGQ